MYHRLSCNQPRKKKNAAYPCRWVVEALVFFSNCQFCVVKQYDLRNFCMDGKQEGISMRIAERIIVSRSITASQMETENGAGGLPVSFLL